MMSKPESIGVENKNLDINWLQSLKTLTARFSGLGICDDLNQLPIEELWGLYCYLDGLE
jgi:hypothetical protein